MQVDDEPMDDGEEDEEEEEEDSANVRFKRNFRHQNNVFDSKFTLNQFNFKKYFYRNENRISSLTSPPQFRSSSIFRISSEWSERISRMSRILRLSGLTKSLLSSPLSCLWLARKVLRTCSCKSNNFR